MYIWAGYTRIMSRIGFWLIVIASVVRIVTNFLYGMHYQDANAEVWADVYYKGLAVFELLVLMGAARMVKELMHDRYFLAISFFTDLAIYAMIKEYLLNPMQWQVFEEAGFLFSTSLLVIRLATSRERRIRISNLIKLLLK